MRLNTSELDIRLKLLTMKKIRMMSIPRMVYIIVAVVRLLLQWPLIYCIITAHAIKYHISKVRLLSSGSLDVEKMNTPNLH